MGWKGPRVRKLMAAGLAVLFVPAAAGRASDSARPSTPPLPPASLEALSLLHQGRFDAASSAFAEISRRRPGDPEGPLFEALTIWWRLIDLPEDAELRAAIEERLAEAMRRAEDLIGRGDLQRGRIFAGTACLLTAQTQALSGGYLAAGRAARAGHEHLEAALATDPQAADARFALGAYKYFAARLPWLVRLLRVFVRLPGGSVEEGLEALESAASGGVYFRAEALLLLAYIHSENEEEDLRQALGYLARARQIEPSSPLLAAIEAKFLFDLGRLGECERAARESLGLTAGMTGVAPAVPALARLRLAFALYYQYRHGEAMTELEQLGSSRMNLSPDARARMDGLLARLRDDSAGLAQGEKADGIGGAKEASSISAAPLPADARAREAIRRLQAGKPGEATAELERAAAQWPEDTVVRYHLARAYQIAGDHLKAEQELQRLLSSSGRVPKTLRGWALLRIGAAMEADGRVDEAFSYYRRGESLRGFLFRAAAADRLKHPAESFFPEG